MIELMSVPVHDPSSGSRILAWIDPDRVCVIGPVMEGEDTSNEQCRLRMSTREEIFVKMAPGELAKKINAARLKS